MIRKVLANSQAEAWSIGLSWCHHHPWAAPWSKNWNSNQDFSWCWAQARFRSNFVVGSIPRSWSHWI